MYTHKPESLLENGTRKIFMDSEIQTDHPILARRSDLVLINKKRIFRGERQSLFGDWEEQVSYIFYECYFMKIDM